MDPDTLIRRVTEMGDVGRSFGYLCTPNVDHGVRSASNPLFGDLYARSWANVNDSRMLQKLAHMTGLDLPACPGSDLTARLLADVIDPAEPVVIIGASQEVVAAITQRYGLTDVRWHAPPMGLRTNPDALNAAAAFIVANPARFHFLCVGSPQQEMVARAACDLGQAVGLGLCVGASLEFLAGTRKRAPLWMQRAGLEWSFRLLSEPRTLWKRYLVEGPRIFWLWARWMWQRQPGASRP